MADRDALLAQIRKGKSLKHAQTNDRSTPLISKSSSSSSSSHVSIPSAPIPPNSNHGNSSNKNNASNSMTMGAQPLAGLFAGGMPKLRSRGGGVDTGALPGTPGHGNNGVNKSYNNKSSHVPSAPPVPQLRHVSKPQSSTTQSSTSFSGSSAPPPPPPPSSFSGSSAPPPPPPPSSFSGAPPPPPPTGSFSFSGPSAPPPPPPPPSTQTGSSSLSSTNALSSSSSSSINKPPVPPPIGKKPKPPVPRSSTHVRNASIEKLTAQFQSMNTSNKISPSNSPKPPSKHTFSQFSAPTPPISSNSPSSPYSSLKHNKKSSLIIDNSNNNQSNSYSSSAPPPPPPPPPPPASSAPSIPLTAPPSIPPVSNLSHSNSSSQYNRISAPSIPSTIPSANNLSHSNSSSHAPRVAPPPPPPPPSNGPTPRANLRNVSASSFTINGISTESTNGTSTSDKRSSNGVHRAFTIDDSRFSFQDIRLFPKPRRFTGKQKLYPSGRGSSVPLNLSAL